MATFRHGKTTAVYLNGTDMSPYLNDASATSTIETAETTSFSDADKTYIVGHGDGTISTSGMFDSTSGASDAVLRGILGTPDDALTILPEGSALASRAIVANGQLTNYEVSSPIGDVVAIAADFQADGGVYEGFALTALTTTSASATTGTGVDYSASTSNGILANLHVTSNNRDGAGTFKVQHSTDNSTYVDLVTFTAVSASTTSGESITSTGTVNRYLRATSSLAGSTGSVSFHISAARR